MLDIKLIRENPDSVKKDLKRRPDANTKIVDEVLKADEVWRKEKTELDKLKSEKNKESKNIAKIKKEGGDMKAQLDKVKKIAEQIEFKDKELKDLESKRDEILIKIPNILDKEVPKGNDDEDNKELEKVNKKLEYSFKVKSHRELCEQNGWYDMEKAAKVSGARFYYLKGEIVELQLNLFNYVMTKMREKGYIPVEVPPMLRTEYLGKSVSLEEFDEAIYKIEDEDLCLIGTSEHALALLHEDELLNHKDLPIKYAGISQCFRKEAGVTKDSKGIFRVHNFNKIEQFVFSKPEDSDKLHEEITNNAREIFDDLEIHYRIVDICSGDIGSFATRKYDIEGYLPSQDKYRELVSSSNYRDYGARRLNTRYQSDKGDVKHVHTLNSTAISLARALIAIIETHQTEDGNVRIPEKIRSYFGGREYLIEK